MGPSSSSSLSLVVAECYFTRKQMRVVCVFRKTTRQTPRSFDFALCLWWVDNFVVKITLLMVQLFMRHRN